jgi:hypothetical protein
MEQEKLRFAAKLAEEREARALASEEAKNKRDATIRIESEEAARTGLKTSKADEKNKDFHGPFQDEELRIQELAGDYTPKDSEVYRTAQTEAMKRGASSGLLNTINAQYKDSATRERQADKDAFDLRKQESLEADRKADNDRLERALAARSSGGGGGSSSSSSSGRVSVRRVIEQAGGEMVAVMSDGSTKKLGMKSAAYNKTLSSVIAAREKIDGRFAKLPETEKQQWAEDRLAGGDVGSTEATVTPENKPAPATKRGVFNPATGKVEWK